MKHSDLFPGATGNCANYRGDVGDDVMVMEKPFGPDRFGAYYTPVGAMFDPSTGLTNVQFRPIPVPAAGEPTQATADQFVNQDNTPLTRQQRRQFNRLTKKAQKETRR